MTTRALDPYDMLVGKLDIGAWVDNATCGGKAQTLNGPDIRAARNLCLGNPLTGQPRCPVITQCTEWVLNLTNKDDPEGVCAGLTQDERATARRVRAENGPRKRCPRCEETKPTGAFHRNTKRADGRASYCADCCADMKATNRASAQLQPARKKAAA